MATQANQKFVALMDEFGNQVPIHLMSDAHAALTINNVSDRVTLPGTSAVAYIVSVTKDCWIRTGDNTVIADKVASRLFLKGTELDRFPVGHTHIAAITDDGTTGTLGITATEGEA